jgi:valyl-tRNA synthetase
MAIYKLVWEDFCSWLLELVKPNYQQPIDSKSYHEIIAIFENNLKILHPFMPFLTEEIWQYMAERSPEDALIISMYPEMQEFDEQLISDFEIVKDIISGIRTIRKQKNISFKDTIELSAINNDNLDAKFNEVIIKMGNISEYDEVARAPEGALSFRVRSNEYFIPVKGAINVEAEIKKLTEELKYAEGFLKSVQKKLSNERFVNNAPEQVVASEKKKEADAIAKIETLKKSLVGLN